MPTKRQRKRRHRIADVSPAMWAMLTDSELEDPSEHFFIDPDALRQAWEICRARILAEWVVTQGGTRPSHWWKFDAPEPRRLLSGAGCPAWERFAYSPYYRDGVPCIWAGWDDQDPPVFETQVDYLIRHRLLAPGEARI